MVINSYLGSRVGHKLPAVDAIVLSVMFLCEWREKTETVLPNMVDDHGLEGYSFLAWMYFFCFIKREEITKTIG